MTRSDSASRQLLRPATPTPGRSGPVNSLPAFKRGEGARPACRHERVLLLWCVQGRPVILLGSGSHGCRHRSLTPDRSADPLRQVGSVRGRSGTSGLSQPVVQPESYLNCHATKIASTASGRTSSAPAGVTGLVLGPCATRGLAAPAGLAEVGLHCTPPAQRPQQRSKKTGDSHGSGESHLGTPTRARRVGSARPHITASTVWQILPGRRSRSRAVPVGPESMPIPHRAVRPQCRGERDLRTDEWNTAPRAAEQGPGRQRTH